MNLLYVHFKVPLSYFSSKNYTCCCLIDSCLTTSYTQLNWSVSYFIWIITEMLEHIIKTVIEFLLWYSSRSWADGYCAATVMQYHCSVLVLKLQYKLNNLWISKAISLLIFNPWVKNITVITWHIDITPNEPKLQYRHCL